MSGSDGSVTVLDELSAVVLVTVDAMLLVSAASGGSGVCLRVCMHG